MNKLFGGIEAGGTKFVCAIGTSPDDLREVARFPTTTPEQTFAQVIKYFQKQAAAGNAIQSLGIASFGPVDVHPESETFGYITSTPKPGWRNADFVGPMKAALQVPVAFDTDVNVAAMGEQTWGAAQGLETFIYLTIGTGIGGGGFMNGKMMHGLLHPEMGHIRIPHDLKKDPYPGCCPFHGDCFEGLASGPAIQARWNMAGNKLPADHPAWLLEAEYLAYALVNYICTMSPQKIILGGGVMDQESLFPLIRLKVKTLLNDYVDAEAIRSQIDQYIVPPALGNQAGVLGAIALAKQI